MNDTFQSPPPTSRRTSWRHRTAALSTIAVLMLASACGGAGAADSPDSEGIQAHGGVSNVSATSLTANTVEVADTHADSDDGDWSADGATTVTLADGASKVDGSGASVDGDVVTITAAGTYLLSGELTDGQVVVNSTGEGKVKLVLDGVDITSSDTSPMVIAEADEAVVILADGSTNELADSKVSGADDEEDDAPNATLFSMADLTIAGTGSLQVSGNSNDGIASKDGLVILSGEVEVTATDDGVRGKDYLVIEGGTVTVVAGGDGLKSDNETEGELGWVQLDAGTVIIDAGDDGVDAIGAINVAGGTLRVIKSEEGLEAATITIAGGTVDVTANDDGLNATDGSEATEAAQDGVLISITGGDVAVTAGSDGIDSNGSTIITGGTTVVSTAARGGGDGSIDVNGALAVNGGTLVALGGLADSPASDSEQGFVAANLDSSVAAGQQIAVVGADGTVVVRYVVDSAASAVIVSSDEITNGEDYEVMSGDPGDETGLSTGGSTDGLTTVGTTTAGEAVAGMGMGGPGGDPAGQRPNGEGLPDGPPAGGPAE